MPVRQFYVLSPETVPPATLPEFAVDGPFYQVSFADLVPTGDRNCGIEVVSQFPDLLRNKKDRKKQKTS